MIRRTLTVAAATLAIVGAGIATADLASAHDNAVTGGAVCNHDTGQVDVAWTVTNDYGLTETLSNATRVQSQLNGHTVGKVGTIHAYESVAAGTGTISLSVHGKWSDNYSRDDQSAGVQIPAVCQQTQHVTVAASFTDQTCDKGTGTYTPGTYDAPPVAGTDETTVGDTNPGDTLTVTYTPQPYVVIDGSSTFAHTYPTNPTAGTCHAPPPPPKVKHASYAVQKYPSCLRSERFVRIVHRHNVARVTLTHGPKRQRWVVELWSYKHAAFARGAHHARVVVHLRHVGACGQPSPGSGRA